MTSRYTFSPVVNEPKSYRYRNIYESTYNVSQLFLVAYSIIEDYSSRIILETHFISYSVPFDK